MNQNHFIRFIEITLGEDSITFSEESQSHYLKNQFIRRIIITITEGSEMQKSQTQSVRRTRNTYSQESELLYQKHLNQLSEESSSHCLKNRKHYSKNKSSIPQKNPKCVRIRITLSDESESGICFGRIDETEGQNIQLT